MEKNMRNSTYQVLNDYNYLYFFQYTWENNRRVILHTKDEVENNKHEAGLEGIIFSPEQITENMFGITKMEDVLKKYDAKILYFNNFENRY